MGPGHFHFPRTGGLCRAYGRLLAFLPKGFREFGTWTESAFPEIPGFPRVRSESRADSARPGVLEKFRGQMAGMLVDWDHDILMIDQCEFSAMIKPMIDFGSA